MMEGKCEVCQRVREVVVASYPYGAISIAYCNECIRKGAYPRWLLECTILECGGWDKMQDGFGDQYFFDNGEYHLANEIKVTKEAIDEFWEGFEKACSKIPQGEPQGDILES